MIEEMPAESVDLVFTSPPYFNARPEYSDYEQYEQYLFKMRQVIKRAHRVLAEGRFFVMNTAPVLLRRASRSEASKRIAVPFDLHRIFVEEGYDFIDDIIWVKPEGAGWATGRERRFAADRNPLQYKAVPVTETEYVLVYRKRTDSDADHDAADSDFDADASDVGDNHERTQIWEMPPDADAGQPERLRRELAHRVITAYSHQDNVVLDPFAGIGTVGAAAAALGRRFVLFEISDEKMDILSQEARTWLVKGTGGILWCTSSAYFD